MKENPDHRDELKDAPILRKIGNKDPFVVPKGYFEGLETDASLYEEEPKGDFLNSIDKASIFKTPDNYFEGILPEFEQRRDAENIGQSRSMVSPGKVKPFSYLLAIAAAILLLLLVFYPSDKSSFDPGNVEFAELEDFSLDELLAEVELERLSEDMILASLAEDVGGIGLDRDDEMDLDFIEEKEEDLDDLIEEIDVYTLEDELDNLN